MDVDFRDLATSCIVTLAILVLSFVLDASALQQLLLAPAKVRFHGVT